MAEEQVQPNLNVLINKHKSTIFNLLIVLLAVYLSFKIYAVEARKIAQLSAEKEASLKKNETLSEIVKLEDKTSSYRSFMNKDITLAINTLAEIAKDSSVRIVSVAPEQEQKFNAYTRYPFGLAIESDNYNFLGVFISKLESHHDIYIVDSVNIKPQAAEANGKKTKLNAALKISTVVFK